MSTKLTNENFKAFYKRVRAELKSSKISLVVKKAKTIKCDDGHYAGYFDGNSLVVAVKNSLFQETFVHEYCHFLQFKEKSPLWEKIQDDDIFSKFLKKKARVRSRWDSLFHIIALERDCERRAIALGKKYDLFDIESYTRRANAYLIYHHYMFLRGGWVNGIDIYSDAIIQKMSPKLLPLASLSKIDMSLMSLYDKKRKK